MRWHTWCSVLPAGAESVMIKKVLSEMLMRAKTKYFSIRPHFDESDGGVLDSRAMIISAQGHRWSTSLHPQTPISTEPKPFNSNLIFFFFSGEYCETEINECGSFPCQHNGTCVDSPGRYTCRCPAGTWTRHLSVCPLWLLQIFWTHVAWSGRPGWLW